jgi:restriction system protein
LSIWIHAEIGVKRSGSDPIFSASGVNEFRLARECVYCNEPMRILAGSHLPSTLIKGMREHVAALRGCSACGWWNVSSVLAEAPYHYYDAGYVELRQVSGVLRNLDLTDLSIPTNELRSYLVARYSDRFDVHPRKYEEIVAGVFSDFGFRVRLTSFSGDEGIDIFVFDGDDNKTVGVQVKKHKGKIAAEQIRAFVGALQLQGLTSGIYVTTSSYQRGAVRTAVEAGERLGLAVKLLDAQRFYSALQITSRPSHLEPEDATAPHYQPWRDVRAYLSAGDQRWTNMPWLENADYIWGSSW